MVKTYAHRGEDNATLAVRPQSKWRERCRALLQSADSFVLNGMGFPADWQTLALWK